MRKNVLVMSLMTLLIFGCSTSDDELQIENEVVTFDFENFYNMLQQENAKLNENNEQSKPSDLDKNNENGVKSVAFYSDGGYWVADFPIYDKEIVTHWVNIAFPRNGEDRALVFNETDMMVNFTSHDPRVRIWEMGNGWVYSNWCEQDRNGLYKGRGKTGYVIPEWNPDVYWWGPYAPVEGDDNYIFNIKATLHPTFVNHPCAVLEESIDFSYSLNGRNGNVKQTSTIR